MTLDASKYMGLDLHLRRYKHPEVYRPKVIQIIEMTSRGCTWGEIQQAVKMGKGNIGAARDWGRKRGLC